MRLIFKTVNYRFILIIQKSLKRDKLLRCNSDLNNIAFKPTEFIKVSKRPEISRNLHNTQVDGS